MLKKAGIIIGKVVMVTCCLKHDLKGDTKSTPCQSLDLHLSVIKIRPNRGQLICSKKL